MPAIKYFNYTPNVALYAMCVECNSGMWYKTNTDTYEDLPSYYPSLWPDHSYPMIEMFSGMYIFQTPFPSPQQYTQHDIFIFEQAAVTPSASDIAVGWIGYYPDITDSVIDIGFVSASGSSIQDEEGNILTEIDLRQALSVLLSLCAGKSSGVNLNKNTNTVTFKPFAQPNALFNRVEASVDVHGNRTVSKVIVPRTI